MPQVGDEVLLQRSGRDAVTIQRRGRDSEKQRIEEAVEVYRNRRVIESQEFLGKRATVAQLVRDEAIAACDGYASTPSSLAPTSI